jgi:chemotaxis protein methyltransferase CheR
MRAQTIPHKKGYDNMLDTYALSSFKADPISEVEHRLVSEFIESTAGIQMPASKRTLIETRLRKRQRLLGFNNLRDYINFALKDLEGASERQNLLDALTTNKTDFYREDAHFLFLKAYLDKHRYHSKDPLKIWSAGCSSGEEPYTLSIEMLEIQRQYPSFDFRITATDISSKCLDKARIAIYPHEKVEPIELALRQRYLLRSKDPSKNIVKIAPEARAPVKFNYFNLITGDWRNWQAHFDVIFCRNVMIYFNNLDRSLLTERFYNALKQGGILMIGHSESLIDNTGLFERLQPTIYRKL